MISTFAEICRVDTFEQFLNKKYKTTKRFGVDGVEASVSGVTKCIMKAAEHGVEECLIGMPHRGRLNILTNVVGKPKTTIFAEFKDTHYDLDRVMGEFRDSDWSSYGD